MSRKMYNEVNEEKESDFKLPPATKTISTNKLIKTAKRKPISSENALGSK